MENMDIQRHVIKKKNQLSLLSPYPTPGTKEHIKMLLFPFSLLLNNIPLSKYATFYLSAHQLTLGYSTF